LRAQVNDTFFIAAVRRGRETTEFRFNGVSNPTEVFGLWELHRVPARWRYA